MISFLLPERFSHQRYLMVFHRCLSDSKFLQVTRTFLSFLADLNNAVVWIVSTRPLISKSFSPGINSLVTVQRAPITIGVIVTSMLLIFFFFFNSLTTSRYLSFFFFSFNIGTKVGTAKSTILQVLFFFCWLRLIVWPRLRDPLLSQNPRGICASHSPE